MATGNITFTITSNAGLVAANMSVLKLILPARMQAITTRSGKAVTDELAKYPPMRAGQRYVRTYDLRHGWLWPLVQQTNTANSSVYSATNPVSYTWYVQSDQGQAWMHKGRWITVNQVLAGAIPDIEQIIDQEITVALQAARLI